MLYRNLNHLWPRWVPRFGHLWPQIALCTLRATEFTWFGLIRRQEISNWKVFSFSLSTEMASGYSLTIWTGHFIYTLPFSHYWYANRSALSRRGTFILTLVTPLVTSPTDLYLPTGHFWLICIMVKRDLFWETAFWDGDKRRFLIFRLYNIFKSPLLFLVMKCSL